MVDERIQEENWESLQRRGDEPFSDTNDVKESDVKEEDATKFAPELIHDIQENSTEEQRENLYQKIGQMSAPEKLRLAIFGNREARNLLIRDPNKLISLAVLRNGKINESEILHYAQKRDLCEDIVQTIAKDQRWKKHYPIKCALVSNPKTPLSVAFNLLPHLQERDLKSLSRDKNVSSVLKQKAHEILLKRHAK